MNELQQRVLAEARSWLGTPWLTGDSCAKGAGVDCSRFVWAVMHASGLCAAFKFPVVPAVYCMERKNSSLILDFLNSHPELVTEVDGLDYQPCDIATFREGVVVHHVGIVLEDGISMISCRQPDGVSIHVFKGDDYFAKRLNKVFRPKVLCQ